MVDEEGKLKTYNHNFKLTEPLLRKIHSVLEDYSNKLDYTSYVECYIDRSDETYLRTSDIERILEEENTPGKLIQGLGMRIVNSEYAENNDNSDDEEDNCARAFVSFSAKRNEDEKVNIGVSYKDRDWAFLLLDELDSQVSRCLKNKPFKGYTVRIAEFFVIFILFFLLIMTLTSYVVSTENVPLEELLSRSVEGKIDYLVESKYQATKVVNEGSWMLVVAIAMPVILFLVAFELKPLRRLYDSIQKSVFYWGDMIEIYDKHIRTKSRVIWGVIITFAVGVAASYFAGVLI